MQLPPFPSVSPAVLSPQGGCGAAKRCKGCFFSLCHLEMFVLDLTATSYCLYAHLHMSNLTVVHFRTNSLVSKFSFTFLKYSRRQQLNSFELPLSCCIITLSACLLPECVRGRIYLLWVCVCTSVCLPSLSETCHTHWSHLPLGMGADLAFVESPLAEVLSLSASSYYLLLIVHVIVHLMVLS